MNSNSLFLMLGSIILSIVIVFRFAPTAGWTMLVTLILALSFLARQQRRG